MRQVFLDTLTDVYNRQRFKKFSLEFFNTLDLSENKIEIDKHYQKHIQDLIFLGSYEDVENKKLHILEVKLKTNSKLEQARTLQRNVVAKYLKDHWLDGALVSFYSENSPSWRLSFVKIEYKFDEKGKTKEELTPAKRFSFLVGKDEPTHTAQTQLFPIFNNTSQNPTLQQIEEAFGIEKVTKEFFGRYRELFELLRKELRSNHTFINEAEKYDIDTENFAKKLLGQIVFLYFLQKKGWLGIPKGKSWGEGDKNFLSELYKKCTLNNQNFYNDYLEKLFYDTLNNPRRGTVDPSYSKYFDSRIPFLNGGLFEAPYDWKNSLMHLDNEIFRQIFDVFNLYNFTVKEDEPLEKEVAVDPEMLGKVFENLIEENLRKGKGTYYTPREIVRYMCQESLINYLKNKTRLLEEKVRKLVTVDKTIDLIKDLREQIKEKSLVLSDREVKNFDNALTDIKVCDPACGSGAFLVGMLQIIVSTREKLTGYLNLFGSNTRNRSEYQLKKATIQNSIYGVDIDPGAIEIAKLRLWLSLVVDYELEQIEPLPNLDYKLMVGNSLIEKINVSLFSKGSDMDKNELIDELKKLKDLYFETSDIKTKSDLRLQINEHIRLLINYDNEREREKIWAQIMGRKNQLNMFVIEKESEQQSFADVSLYTKKLESIKDLTETDHFEWHLNFNEVFEGGGFDVIIANPPYIGEKGNKEIFRPLANSSLGERFYKRKMDIFYFFFHLGLDLLKDGGFLGFITTNYYVTADQAVRLRLDFKNRAVIKRLINFNELRIFDSAQGQHNMITMLIKDRNLQDNAENCITQRTGLAKNNEIKSIIGWKDDQSRYYSVKQDDLYEGNDDQIRLQGLDFTSSKNNSILAKIKLGGEPLQNVCVIFGGVETGSDKVTKSLLNNSLDKGNLRKSELDKYTLGEGIYILSQLELDNLHLNSNEKDLIKKWYKSSDIFPFGYYQNNPEYLIYVDSKVNIGDYPNIEKHLRRFRPLLISREQANNESNNWFWIRGSKRQFFSKGEYLVCPYRNRINAFAYSRGDFYSSRDVYYLILKEGEEIHYKYLLALLNSKLVFFWSYHKGKRKGEALELYQKPLSEIPIKVISKSEQKPFIDIVDEILLSIKDHQNKPSHLSTKWESLKSRCDQLVYKLYGLTPEEIAVVEGSKAND